MIETVLTGRKNGKYSGRQCLEKVGTLTAEEEDLRPTKNTK